MQFERGKSVKESLEIGYAPIFKEIQRLVSETIERYSLTWWSYDTKVPDEDKFTNKIVKWKNIPGGSNNIHRMIGIVLTKNPGSLREAVQRGKENFKGIFKQRDFKYTTTNTYTGEKWYKKFGVEREPNSMIIEVIYSINKK